MGNKIKIGLVVLVVIALAFLGLNNFGSKKSNQPINTDRAEVNGNNILGDDFIKMGERSFGVDVCNEMTQAEVASVINKDIVRVESYSNSGSTGCEYFVTENSFVIVDVGFGDMAKQKTGLEFLDRIIKTDARIKLENFLAYTEKGLNDVYMNVASGQKYVRVGRSSTLAVDEETLIELAVAVEAKIRSFK